MDVHESTKAVEKSQNKLDKGFVDRDTDTQMDKATVGVELWLIDFIRSDDTG